MAQNTKTHASTKTSRKKRTLKQQTYKSFRLSKPIKYTGRDLPSSWKLLKHSTKTLWKYKKVLGGVLLVYGIVQLILAQSLAGNFSELKNIVDEVFGSIAGGVVVFTYLLGTIGQANSAEASVYQSILFVIGSLAFIWALRQLLADKTIRIRDAYYRGMHPLIPFILVLLVIGLQTIPALIGAWLYSVVISNGIAVSIVEQLFWLIVCFIIALLSIYMICSSVFALYIVTLPDMTPMKALRSARELVRYRRWTIVRKIIVFVIVAVMSFAMVMLPIIWVVPVAAPVVFYLLSVLLLGMGHTYIYTIYRELLIDE